MEYSIKFAEELSYISKLVGQDERLVQAGGGNTSVKINDRYMLVKASGFQLTDVTARQGYSVVDYRLIVDRLASGDIGVLSENEILSAALVEGKRPSIETFLHSVTQRYTIHTHPLGVTMYAASEDGMEKLHKLFPQSAAVDYATPGIKLAVSFFETVWGHKDISVVFLKNHGLVVSGNSMKEVIELHENIVKKIDTSLGLDTSAVEMGRKLFEALQRVQKGVIAYRIESEAVMKALIKARGAWEHAFSPDCVVYCGTKIAKLDLPYETSLRDYIKSNGEVKAAVVGGYVFAIAENVKKARDIACMIDFTAKVFLSGKDLVPLSEDERRFLYGWDSEKYRTSMT